MQAHSLLQDKTKTRLFKGGALASQTVWNIFFDPLNPRSDQHVISPYSNTAELFIKIMRIKEL